jgi:hypothetical protein
MANDEHENLDTVLDRLERPDDPAAELPHRAECQSPTVVGLQPGRHAKPSPICAACPRSLWFASTEHLRCFCRLAHVVTWNSEEPSSPIAGVRWDPPQRRLLWTRRRAGKVGPGGARAPRGVHRP